MNSTESQTMTKSGNIVISGGHETFRVPAVIHIIEPMGLSKAEIEKYIFPKMVEEYKEKFPESLSDDGVFHVWYTPEQMDKINETMEERGLEPLEFFAEVFKAGIKEFVGE